jgi:hypothetical protein
MKSRKQAKTPSDRYLNYWYKQALNYLKEFPLSSEKELNKLAEDFALYACREYYGYRGAVPKTKIKATKEVLLDRFKRSSIIKKQLGIGTVFIAR